MSNILNHPKYGPRLKNQDAINYLRFGLPRVKTEHSRAEGNHFGMAAKYQNQHRQNDRLPHTFKEESGRSVINLRNVKRYSPSQSSRFQPMDTIPSGVYVDTKTRSPLPNNQQSAHHYQSHHSQLSHSSLQPVQLPGMRPLMQPTHLRLTSNALHQRGPSLTSESISCSEVEEFPPEMSNIRPQSSRTVNPIASRDLPDYSHHCSQPQRLYRSNPNLLDANDVIRNNQMTTSGPSIWTADQTVSELHAPSKRSRSELDMRRHSPLQVPPNLSSPVPSELEQSRLPHLLVRGLYFELDRTSNSRRVCGAQRQKLRLIDNVSFDIRAGEVLGILSTNGKF